MRYAISAIQNATEPITQAEVAERLKLLPVSTDESSYTITPLITAAREYCEARTGYAFMPQRITAYPTEDDLAGRYFYLPRVPVVEVESVTVNGEATSDYECDGEGAMRISGVDLASLSGLNPVAVTYKAGEATCPASAKQAMLLLIGHWYQNRESVQTGAVTAVEVAQTTDALLRLYRRWW